MSASRYNVLRGSRDFSNQGPKQYSTPKPTPSGLLADSMGLGKTLSLLSAVVHTLDEARLFEFVQSAYVSNIENDLFTKATMVVVPSSRKLISSLALKLFLTKSELIEVWRSEIER